MDTISQEENESFSWLPVLALIVGLIAGALAGVALSKVANLNKSIADQSALTARIDSLEAELRKTATSTEQASVRINKVAADTNNALKNVGEAFSGLRAEFEEAKSAAAAPPPAVASSSSSSSSSAPPVAGPNEYVVKSGDTGSKIARDAGVSLSDLLAVNPGVNWNRLGVGQTIKLPQK